MPIEELTSISDWASTLRITKSQLQTYLLCPRKFFYQYVIGQEWETVPVAMIFGRVMHQVAATFYKYVQECGVKPDIEMLLAEFEMAWAVESSDPRITYGSEQTPETLAAQGKAMVRRFHADVVPRKVEAIEHPFAVDIIDPDTGKALEQKLVGIIDLIESDEDGTVLISELKTKAKKMSDGEAENQLDGLIYAYAMEQLGYRTTEAGTLVRIDVLTKTKTPAFQQVFVTKEDGDYRKLARWVKAILEAIERESFYPQFGWACKGCPFYKACMGGMVR
jgi:CRISPR/Cas system-associated exonuclease Cas4 (RecB family)